MTAATLALPRQRTTSERSWLHRRFGTAWPLKLLLVGFPLWWALGVGSLTFFIAAAAMGVQMVRRRTLRVPAGFGVWILFLAWMLLGVTMLWADAPGTLSRNGIGPLVGFGYWAMWYGAVTIAMLYPLSIPSDEVSSKQIARWLACLFLAAVVGGLAAFVAPSFEFTSPAELVVPGARGDTFLNALMHPALSIQSDFLGYDQPRPKAPFAYPNAWGNNIGLLLPVFVYAAVATTKRGGLARFGTPLLLVLLLVPVVFSLNRGLWLGLGIIAVYGAVSLARVGRHGALFGLGAAVVAISVLLVASPLGSTIALRLNTPHSNERRTTVASVVVGKTWAASPLLGYGSNRQVSGSFSSIAGGQTPECHQCAAPPLGTQGFMWRLIFTTGFVGTALFVAFIAVQFLTHVRRRTPFALIGCIGIATSALFFFVYDSLESPLFVLMLLIGLMNRERLDERSAFALGGVRA